MNEWNIFFGEHVGHFQTVGIALLTVMIPLGIAIVQELLSPERRAKFPQLDLHTIMSEVISPKKFVLILGFVFIAPFFWEFPFFSTENWFPGSGGDIVLFFDLVILGAWGIGIWGLIKILGDLLGWVRSDWGKFEKRKEFLKKLGEKTDKKSWEIKWNCWNEIWKEKYPNILWENRFWPIFVETVPKKVEEKPRLLEKSRLLGIFEENLEKRAFLNSNNPIQQNVWKQTEKWVKEEFKAGGSRLSPGEGMKILLKLRKMADGRALEQEFLSFILEKWPVFRDQKLTREKNEKYENTEWTPWLKKSLQMAAGKQRKSGEIIPGTLPKSWFKK